MTLPLTPPGCDLRDFPKLMIDVPRLFASGFNATASRNPLAWMIGHKLWYRSWHQVPAGSLPADDDELCHLAELGFDRKSFDKAKKLAMRGWIECDDGRLYHPVVCEAALESWQEKLRQRLSSGIGNEKRWKVSFDTAPVADDLRSLIACMERLNPQSKTLMKARKSLSGIDGSVPLGSDDDPTGTQIASHRDDVTPGTLSQETGTGTGILDKDANASSVFAEPKTEATAKGGKRKAAAVGPAEFEAAWKAYPHVPGRSSKPKALEHWKALPDEEQAGLVAAIGRFIPNVARAHSKPDNAPCMARWLADGKHRDWMTGPSSTGPVLIEFSGPPELFGSVVKEAGEDFARKWITPCRWRSEDRTLVARNTFSAKKLEAELGDWLVRMKVRVEIAPSNDAHPEAA